MKKILIACFVLFTVQGFAQTVEKSFKVEHQYINIPIESEQDRQRVNFKVDGQTYTYNDIRIANSSVDYWTFIDVSKYMGKTFTLEFSYYVPGIERIYQSDQFVDQDKLYKEKLRPQVHFTTRRGWNNDPNGLVYYEGEYHLYYQHNPYEINWGNMSWGHTISKDLVHWEELPIVMEPDELGTMFSGSAVIDYKNTSGFKKGKENPIVVTYTADLSNEKQHQCMAYSLDRGKTFTKYEGNPVIPAQRRFGSGHERDPKVFWYAPGKHWALVMHDGLNYSIYNSDDLKKWEFQSSVDAGFWECPELFELPVDGKENNKKWVLYGVQGIYLIGDFDGKVFTPETEMLRYQVGGMSAAQTYNNEPDGRRLQIGWGHASYPGMPFAQTFTFVQEFRLETTRNGVRLMIEPAKEIEKLHGKAHHFEDVYIGDEINEKLAAIKSPLLHIKATFEIVNAIDFGININGYRINYNVATNELKGHFLPLQNKQVQVEVIVDKTLIEVYANGGLIYWFDNYNEGDLDDFNISLTRSKNGLNQDSKTLVKSLDIYELKSIWK
jgi:fructan beta-fructosidase